LILLTRLRPLIVAWSAKTPDGDIITPDVMGDLMDFIDGFWTLRTSENKTINDFCYMLFDQFDRPACAVQRHVSLNII